MNDVISKEFPLNQEHSKDVLDLPLIQHHNEDSNYFLKNKKYIIRKRKKMLLFIDILIISIKKF